MFEHRPFGHHLKLTVRGASHAPALTFALENFPNGFSVDSARLASFMARRAPGRDALSTARREADEVRLERMPRGIRGTILNTDMRPADYGAGRTIPRPGHADFGEWIEQGVIPTGGGMNSGRLTAALCAAGGICLQLLEKRGITVTAALETIGGKADAFEETILAARADGDSVGGTIRCQVTGLPAGLGGALFAGIESDLSAALFAIPGVKGVSFGNGFDASSLRGSANDDPFVVEDGIVRTEGNRHGGILGGRTTGMPLVFRLALKPTPTVFKPLASVDLATMTSATCEMKGRHDPCIVRRAVPVVEALTAFVLADRLLEVEATVPRICLTLTGKTLDENTAQLASQRYFSDLVEVRVDCLEPSERARVGAWLAGLPLPAIVTFRRRSDGGAFEGPEAARIAFFKDLLQSSVCAYVDFEDDFRVPELSERARAAGVRIIRSLHDFKGPVANIPARCRELRGQTDEIPKIAFRPKTLADVSRLFKETADFADVPHIVCAMGPQGVASRVLAARTHSLLTYASTGALGALGHLSPQTLVRTYRQRVQAPSFELFGVTGWPLAATRSPELHNAAFAAEDVDAVMFPLPAESAEEAVAFLRAMDLRGLAVTIPHKETIMPLLDELTEEARAIGAVNTVVRCGDRLVGHNTDADGFAAAVTAFVGKADFAGLRVAVLGAGGASKAVVFALKRLGACVEVFHRRTPAEGFDLLVNATPVDPIPDYVFTGREKVYDLVYVPAETPLIARARAAGCAVENGFSMLVEQAKLQRKFWSAQ